MNAIARVLGAIIRSPVLWGILASVAFFAPFEAGAIQSKFVQRYFAGHPVEYTETVMFFVGLAFLVIRALDVAGQYQGLAQPLLPAGRGQPAGDWRLLSDTLAQLSRRRRGEYLVRRLHDGVVYVGRRGTSEGLDEHLKYLADQDAGRMHADYGLLRLVIWAIPILGFLGTVIGITIAIANIAPDALEKSFPEVAAGLGVAFDTTALALGLSIVLMFIQHYVDRAENNLLAEVDRRAEDELLGRFECLSSSGDGQAALLRRIAEEMARTAETLVERQADVWRASIEAANERWTRLADGAGKHLQSVLTASLTESLKNHAYQLSAAEQAASEQNRQHWADVEKALVEAAHAIETAERTLVEKSEVLSRAVDATGQVAKLEETLNRNLAALAGERNFEQTVMSLAAAINLLNARLTPLPPDTPSVQLEVRRRKGQAA